jgi:hypothetical protein
MLLIKNFCEIHKWYLRRLISFQEERELDWRFVSNHGWSNWRLRYQPGQVCRASKVHKIRKTNFVDLHYNSCGYKISETIHKQFVKQNIRRQFSTLQSDTKFSMQNGKVGEGDIFSQQTRFYCLSSIENFDKVLSHYIRDTQFIIRKSNNVTCIANTVLYNITRISKVEPGGDWANGLCHTLKFPISVCE